MTAGPQPLAERFAAQMGRLLGPDFPADIGLAVSGGGDSMAMLHLAAGWARPMGVRLWPVTIDHGLRAASAAEAALVSDEARGLGLPHAVLRWEGWDGNGNLQDAARRARLDLIGRWRGVCAHVLFAHTLDDQAETFLMRLARGSGVEGLSGMAATRRVRGQGGLVPLRVPGGPPWPEVPTRDWEAVRPLLGVTRAELRHYLTVLRIPFADDPSNDDPRYDRVRMRGLLDTLGAAGITRERLAETAVRMGRAREALGRRAHEAARALSRGGPMTLGAVVLDRDGFARLEADTQLRVFAAALQFVASDPYRPREAALEAALDRWLAGGTVTLHGAMAQARGGLLYVFREPNAVAGVAAPTGETDLWDRRWHLHGPEIAGAEVRALGEAGLAVVRADATLAAPAADRPPRALLLSLPAVWRGDQLLACRAMGYGPDHVVEQHPPAGCFPDSLLAD